MYARIIKTRNNRWGSMFLHSSHFNKPSCMDQAFSQSMSYVTSVASHSSNMLIIKRGLLNSVSSQRIAFGSNCSGLHVKSLTRSRNGHLRFFSSQGDGRNTSEGKHAIVKGQSDINSEKCQSGSYARNAEAHALLAEQDQKEWINNEKISIENKKKDSPFMTRRQRFKNEFLRRVVPWEKINVSWENFPYYMNEHTKDILEECVASQLKNKEYAASYGAHLSSSSGRILLQSIPGTELYRERIVRALARELQVPLLVLDSSVLAPYDFDDDCASENESDADAEDVGSDTDDENDAGNDEGWSSNNEGKSESSEDDTVDIASTEVLSKMIPCSLDDLQKLIPDDCDSCSDSAKPETTEPSDSPKQPLKRGDRVRYTGPNTQAKDDKRVRLGKIPTSDGLKYAYTIINGRPISSGQRGEVYEVNGDEVAVIFDITSSSKANDGESDDKLKEETGKAPMSWINIKDIERDPNAEVEDCYIAMEALCEVLQSIQPIIVYFPDSPLWLSRAVPKSNRKDFVNKLQEMFDKLSGPVVLICGQNKVETGSKEREKFTMILPGFGRMANLPLPLKRLFEGLKGTKKFDNNEIYKIFTNIFCLDPPKDDDALRTFNKQIEEDRRIVIARSNLNEIQKVLEENEMSCMDLLHVNTDGVILTKKKAEKIVGWAKNHHLSSCLCPSIKGDRMSLPCESLEIAIARLKEQEAAALKPSQNLKNLAKDEYETNFISAVVPPGEVGVRFEDVGALEDVKKALNELVILPMRRPELFSHGNLLRPCKGILLFGPPGTGKTLLAKALATEARANFMSITGSTLTSKWFGDAEKLTKALFSFASKLAPVIIFVDEVDSLLGARGGSSEHEATRRMKNEFMAAWDGLRSKDSQRILILGATNRPFDLDDAVIRRLPRRIYVDLPDVQNRLKILKVILAQENVQSDFDFEKLAIATEGYSGSDLKNLCIAAAYRPVQDLLENEKEGGMSGTDSFSSAIRPLSLDDFIQSKAKVGPSVAFDASSMNELRKWNEQYGEGGSRKKSPFGFGN